MTKLNGFDKLANIAENVTKVNGLNKSAKQKRIDKLVAEGADRKVATTLINSLISVGL